MGLQVRDVTVKTNITVHEVPLGRPETFTEAVKQLPNVYGAYWDDDEVYVQYRRPYGVNLDAALGELNEQLDKLLLKYQSLEPTAIKLMPWTPGDMPVDKNQLVIVKIKGDVVVDPAWMFTWEAAGASNSVLAYSPINLIGG